MEVDQWKRNLRYVQMFIDFGIDMKQINNGGSPVEKKTKKKKKKKTSRCSNMFIDFGIPQRQLNIRSRPVVCVEVLRPSQPNGVMSSAVSLPNHTFTGQA